MICSICGKETNVVYSGDICPKCWNAPKTSFNPKGEKIKL
jgi:hypothetical protein